MAILQSDAEKFLAWGGYYPRVEITWKYHTPGSLEDLIAWETASVFTNEEAASIVAKSFWIEKLKSFLKWYPLFFLVNTFIISSFSCTFDKFKNDVTNLFLEDTCKEFVTEYEFVKVNDHK